MCDNLAFSGDQTIRRKHTQRLKFELPGLIANIVEPLADRRKEQQLTFERYQATPLSPLQADHAIMNMFREDIINLQRIGTVLDEWEEPSFDWGERTAFRLFNAATYALTGRIAENPTLTRKLHKVIDLTCEHVA